MDLTSSLERLKQSRAEYPIKSLLIIYSKQSKILYLNYFELFKDLIVWIGPIGDSTKPIKSIPHYLLSYEINQLAVILKQHPSQIYQELQEIYHETQT